jgi:cell division protein ZapD
MEHASEQIIFEHPLNERTRTLLRFEHLFNLSDFHAGYDNNWNSRAAMDGILDMLSILLSRTDIKSELLKELSRYKTYFQELATSPEVDQKMLEQALQQIEESNLEIQRDIGQIGHNLRGNDFLQSILNRGGLPGGNCAFDLPLYHYWLEQPANIRNTHLRQWIQSLEPIRKAVTLLLSIMRNSSSPTEEHAEHGIFQMSINPRTQARLIRITLPKSAAIIPKVSGSRHRFSIRFLKIDEKNNTTQINQDIQFQLSCCTI